MQREQFIELPRVIDRRGNLSFIEAENHIPFRIARTYWIYGIPGGQQSGTHAFKSQHEVMVALSGNFDVILDDGGEKRTYTLNRSCNALYIPDMMRRRLGNFSANALCLAIASEPCGEDDHYKTFRRSVAEDNRRSPVPPLKKDKASRPEYNTVFDCSLIEFPVVTNRAGALAFIHGVENIPFGIERIFYTYDIPSGEKRGMHAHKRCHEILIAASGSFEVELDDGVNRKTILLNRPVYGLHVSPGVWATEKEYSSGAICLALASDKYDTEDYIHTYSDFKEYRRNEN
ncbi:MAG: FdtA/QdtA family cupin domain-containing protein [Prevotella sp.]|jgi:oxalate decarboxylase/phosphoglucose isomerase-like protein (cupin superfamily)|nr:FdtA/QdtA family cupin domain-containing protein [Prevotella sp.]